MRKSVAITASMLALAGVLSLTGCGGATASESGGTAAVESPSNGKGVLSSVGKKGIAPEELSEVAEKDVEDTLEALNVQYEDLIAKTGTFDAYRENIDAVQAYYDLVEQETRDLGIRLRQYAADYAANVLASERTPGQMYDDLEVIYDDLYDGAGDDLYDGVYDDLFGNLYDAFYSGVVKDGYDIIGYGEWSEISSAEYDRYSDAQSEVYELISDARSDIYEFGSDVRSDVFGDKVEKAEKELAKFQEKIDKLKEE